jgi:hypothetical protein
MAESYITRKGGGGGGNEGNYTGYLLRFNTNNTYYTPVFFQAERNDLGIFYNYNNTWLQQVTITNNANLTFTNVGINNAVYTNSANTSYTLFKPTSILKADADGVYITDVNGVKYSHYNGYDALLRTNGNSSETFGRWYINSEATGVPFLKNTTLGFNAIFNGPNSNFSQAALSQDGNTYNFTQLGLTPQGQGVRYLDKINDDTIIGIYSSSGSMFYRLFNATTFSQIYTSPGLNTNHSVLAINNNFIFLGLRKITTPYSTNIIKLGLYNNVVASSAIYANNTFIGNPEYLSGGAGNGRIATFVYSFGDYSRGNLIRFWESNAQFISETVPVIPTFNSSTTTREPTFSEGLVYTPDRESFYVGVRENNSSGGVSLGGIIRINANNISNISRLSGGYNNRHSFASAHGVYGNEMWFGIPGVQGFSPALEFRAERYNVVTGGWLGGIQGQAQFFRNIAFVNSNNIFIQGSSANTLFVSPKSSFNGSVTLNIGTNVRRANLPKSYDLNSPTEYFLLANLGNNTIQTRFRENNFIFDNRTVFTISKVKGG